MPDNKCRENKKNDYTFLSTGAEHIEGKNKIIIHTMKPYNFSIFCTAHPKNILGMKKHNQKCCYSSYNVQVFYIGYACFHADFVLSIN